MKNEIKLKGTLSIVKNEYGYIIFFNPIKKLNIKCFAIDKFVSLPEDLMNLFKENENNEFEE